MYSVCCTSCCCHTCLSLPSPQALHEPALKAGITLLNEVGLDPGIDHMLAAQCFDEVRSKGGKVSVDALLVQ